MERKSLYYTFAVNLAVTLDGRSHVEYRCQCRSKNGHVATHIGSTIRKYLPGPIIFNNTNSSLPFKCCFSKLSHKVEPLFPNSLMKIASGQNVFRES